MISFEGFTTSLLLHPPYFLRLGNSPCIEVRDLASGDILKTITDNYFSSLRSNGRFVAAPESQRNAGLRAGDTFYWSSYRSRVAIMDIQGAELDLQSIGSRPDSNKTPVHVGSGHELYQCVVHLGLA